MEIADYIQILILMVLILTALLALKEIKETKNIHKETLSWNKKNKTIDALNDFRILEPQLDKKIFEAGVKKFDGKNPIQIEEILPIIEKNSTIRIDIIELLNHYEGMAVGIKMGLYDKELVKESRGTAFFKTSLKYKNYIEHQRKASVNPTIWENMEFLGKEWNKNVVQQRTEVKNKQILP